MSSAFGGNLAVMDIYAAQQVFGRGRKFDRIDIVVAEGTAVEQAEIAVQAALGPAFAVDPPELRNQSLAALLAGYSVLMTMTSALALVIGMFVVYNAFAVAVTERRTEIGIIRALGATRRQVQMLFLFESVLVGALGAIAGMAVGRAATGVLSVLTADLVTALSGMPQASDDLALGRDLFGAATVGGILTSIVAAWLPARAAARLDPVQALQKGRTQTSSTRETRGRHIAAMAAAAAASVCLFEGSTSVFYWGYGLMTLAVLLLVPTLSAAFARRLTVPLRAVFPVEGALAADSLIQAPKRTAAAIAIVTATDSIRPATAAAVRFGA
jgi:putative ABC transport system permease protein